MLLIPLAHLALAIMIGRYAQIKKGRTGAAWTVLTLLAEGIGWGILVVLTAFSGLQDATFRRDVYSDPQSYSIAIALVNLVFVGGGMYAIVWSLPSKKLPPSSTTAHMTKG